MSGIPTTSVPRTLLDLAGVLPRHQLERAFNEAEMRRLTDQLSVPELIIRYPGRKGVANIRAILDTGPRFTRSDLEARFLEFVRAAGLPEPRPNANVLGFECDCVWPARRLIVELDGGAPHSTRAAFERDRVRDRTLQAAGWRTVRVTWHQLDHDPEALALDLDRMLGQVRRRPRTPPGPSRARRCGDRWGS